MRLACLYIGEKATRKRYGRKLTAARLCTRTLTEKGLGNTLKPNRINPNGKEMLSLKEKINKARFVMVMA